MYRIDRIENGGIWTELKLSTCTSFIGFRNVMVCFGDVIWCIFFHFSFSNWTSWLFKYNEIEIFCVFVCVTLFELCSSLRQWNGTIENLLIVWNWIVWYSSNFENVSISSILLPTLLSHSLLANVFSDAKWTNEQTNSNLSLISAPFYFVFYYFVVASIFSSPFFLNVCRINREMRVWIN